MVKSDPQVDCEAFEGLWHAVEHKTQQGTFFQALIQLAAANLECHLDHPTAANNLARSSLARLKKIGSINMGVDVLALSKDVGEYFDGSRTYPALIRFQHHNLVT